MRVVQVKAYIGAKVYWGKARFSIEALVVGRDLLVFDLLIGLDTIKQLGGVTVTSAGEVTFPQCDRPNCAAITIIEPDFNAEYDKIPQRLAASWKWAVDESQLLWETDLRNILPQLKIKRNMSRNYRHLHGMFLNTFIVLIHTIPNLKVLMYVASK